jgi:hypothetical protein
MRDINRYFDIIESTIRHSGAIDYNLFWEKREKSIGVIIATLWFADQSRLHFSEVVLSRSYRATKLRYSYQYMQDDKTIFRYDNTDHHRRVKTFPHHKHVGRKVVAASEPTLKDVLNEITALMK